MRVSAGIRLIVHKAPGSLLLCYGVRSKWLADVRAATEDTLLTLADHLPAEAAEALLELATGGKPRKSQPIVEKASPFDHPDAQRRFRVMSNVEVKKTAAKRCASSASPAKNRPRF